MRIVGGQFRGRRLNTPKSDAIRPTSDKVRQAVFNMLNARGAVRGAYVLDAYCGTGALGLEALSQGAEHVHFFDKDMRSIQLAKSNAELVAVLPQCVFQKCDSSKLPKRSERFMPCDLVFLDPPYNKNLIAPTVEALIEGNWLDEDAVLVIETEKGYDLDGLELEVEKVSVYGDIQIAITRLNRG